MNISDLPRIGPTRLDHAKHYESEARIKANAYYATGQVDKAKKKTKTAMYWRRIIDKIEGAK
jgi:hypothetical protein